MFVRPTWVTRLSSRRVLRSRWLVALTVMALLVSLAEVVTTTVVASRASRALASAATGTAGQFVSTQGRLLDTRSAYQVGPYSTPMPANTWRKVTVDGALGGAIPSSNVSAVSVNFTVVSPTTSGLIRADKDETTPNGTVTYLNYNANGGLQSNAAIIAVGTDGKIQVDANSSVDLIIDVMGYYTDGDNVAAGGYVPITPVRLADTRLSGTGLPHAQLAPGSTSTLQVTGSTSGIPAGAIGVVLNFAFVNESGNGYIEPYPADAASRPQGSVDYSTAPDASGVQVGLSTTGTPVGAIKIYNSTSSTDLVVDVVGYFSATDSSGAFTPAAVRLIDTRTTGQTSLAGNATTTVQVAGRVGIPAAGSGISAITMNLEVINSGSQRAPLNAWASGATEPGTSAINYNSGVVTSNMVTTALGADGAIQLHNHGSGTIDFVIDIEGWYSNAGSAIPNGQHQTQQSVTLQADPANAGAWVTYNYRVGTTGAFSGVPVGNATDGNGNHPSVWPVTRNGGKFTAYTWNIRDTLSALSGNNGVAPDSLVQVEACYGTSNSDTNPSCGMPSNVQLAQSAFGAGFATRNIGPGSLGELTGDYQISATDADAATALGSLNVGRTLTTLAPAVASAGAGGVFGPGWTADLSSSDSGDADLAVTDQAPVGYLLFTDSDGGVSTYQANTTLGSYPIGFIGVGDATGDGEIVAKVDATHITMTDPDNTVTTWTKVGSGSSAKWQASGVARVGANATTTDTYNAAGLVTRILAPVSAGISCSSPDTTPGCRSLILSYGTPSGTRLTSVSLSIPQTGSTANSIPVAAYDYNSSGQLIDTYDPRITPTLKTAYTYNSSGRLATLSPPGEATWSFGYDSAGRLSTVSRPDPSGATATTTVVYGVPTTGSNAPFAMDPVTTGTWDEISDLPVTGTAVFTAEHNPAGTTPAAVTSGDWPYASIDYLDVNGRQVNGASYGAGAWQIDTTQYDSIGTDVWDLTAGNRAQALNPTGDTDPYVAGLSSNVARAAALASTTVLNPLDPSETTDTFGPTHPVTLDSGTTIDARTHVSTTFDEGAPNNDDHILIHDDGSKSDLGAYRLPTTTVSDPFNAATGADTGFPDASITHTGYDPVVSNDPSGWNLGQPTSSTVQMAAAPSSADLTTYTRYDGNGRTTETRLPGDPNGTGPRTTDTSYYADGSTNGNGPCASDTWIGLVCSTSPAGQPSTGSPLPTKTYSYNQYGDQTSETDTYGSGSSQVVRTTSDTFDTGERHTGHSITVTPTSAGGTALPAVTYGYDNSTGLPTTTSTTTGPLQTTLTTGYDNLGRTTSYTDATGNVTTTGYDINGQIANVNDGKGTTTYIYDSSSEHRGMVTSEDIGVSGAPSTFTATYNASGARATETYPNGLLSATSYDNAGNPIRLTYGKSGSTWMTFTAAIGDQDRIVAQSSPQSSQTFTYDADDRLVATQDTDTSSGACTTRGYTFDDESNRTSLKSYPASNNASCSVGTSPTSTSYSYDAGDRLISDTAGPYSYDTLGRATSIPRGDAIGVGTHASITGSASIQYYSNDMVASEAQGGATDSFTLDPNQKRVSGQSDGGISIVNHYRDGTDKPAWSSSGSAWTKFFNGVDGTIAASTGSDGNTALQLNDLHGNVVATVPDNSSATDAGPYNESTEAGIPRDPAKAYTTYGWMGGAQRSWNGLAGLVLMGARLYDPQTARFESVDSDPVGNANLYIYPDDPINGSDPSGNDKVKCGAEVCISVKSRGGHGAFITSVTVYVAHGNLVGTTATVQYYQRYEYGTSGYYTNILRGQDHGPWPERVFSDGTVFDPTGYIFHPNRIFKNHTFICGAIVGYEGYPCAEVIR